LRKGLAPAVVVACALTVSQRAGAQDAAANASDALAAKEGVRDKIRQILEGYRDKQHIPGAAFVAVKDDKLFIMETTGLRDLAGKLAVTPDTVFPIGSCTKSFTAIAAGICQDQGLMSLDDPPRKYLRWFRMADPEANALVTLRDMLCHRTGLRAYADLAAEPGVLSREEYLRAATSAKPTAKFRAAFQYSNAAFTAAGESIAKASDKTWEALIQTAILEPLGMTASRTSTDLGAALADHAVGYEYRRESKDWKAVPPPRSLAALAPAGAIVASARDLVPWLRFLAAGGGLGGRRILSDATFRDITRPHVPINDKMSYALGFVTHQWNGHAVVEHNGGSAGICALFSVIPERRAGFALLGNTSPNEMTAIGKAGRVIWPLLLEESEPPAGTTQTAQTASKPEAKPTPGSRSSSDLPSVDDLFTRMIAAYGGERNIRRHTSMTIHARKVYENQGVQSDLVIFSSAPDSHSEEESWIAAGKSIGRVRSYCDGERAGQETTFGQDATYSGDELETARRKSARHGILDARKLYNQVTVDRKEILDGEETLVIKFSPKSGVSVWLFVSSRTALVLKEQTVDESTRFGDHRNIDGEVVPFRMTIDDPLGETTIQVLDVAFNTEIPPAKFAPSIAPAPARP
jgi:CubicO group peptidase (beta-lactamase class C family)